VTAGGQGYKVDFENEDNFGIFTGADVIFNDVFSINCEGRFIDETAVTAGAKVRF
jgi:hypothetical protein